MFPSQIEELILRCSALSPHYRIEVTRPERLDEVTVEVEARAGVAPEQAKQAADELRRHIKTVIGVAVRVNVCEPLSIERSTGKAVRVRDLR
jgi:phenylacetate-CoA ligase